MAEIGGGYGQLTVAVAPNAFKGTLSATEACRAIAEGVAQAWPRARIRQLPLSDGGDGFLETLVSAQAGTTERILVSGPLLEPVSAPLGWLGRGGDRTAVAELALACGLRLVARPSPETAVRASTMGLGELLRVAMAGSPARLLIGIGGSSSTDGGAGIAQALGFRLLDRAGRSLAPGGLALLELDRIEPPRKPPAPAGLEVVAACDVDNPLLGEQGAAAVFGPQKGADPATVALLDRALSRLAEVVARDLGLAGLEEGPGMGAAGGTGFGLTVFLGARLQSGLELVAEAAGLDRALDGVELVLTGEGRFDDQSLHGKVTGEVLRRAAARRLTCVVLAGSADPISERRVGELGGRVVLTRPEGGAPEPADRARAEAELRTAAARACRELGPAGPGPLGPDGPGQ